MSRTALIVVVIIIIAALFLRRGVAEGYSNFGARPTVPTPAIISDAAMPGRLPAYGLAPVAHMVYPEIFA